MVDAAIKQTYPMTVAYASGQGSYDRIQDAFRRLYLWTEHHMLVPTGMPVGVYFDDPLETPAHELRWEIWRRSQRARPRSRPRKTTSA